MKKLIVAAFALMLAACGHLTERPIAYFEVVNDADCYSVNDPLLFEDYFEQNATLCMEFPEEDSVFALRGQTSTKKVK